MYFEDAGAGGSGSGGSSDADKKAAADKAAADKATADKAAADAAAAAKNGAPDKYALVFPPDSSLDPTVDGVQIEAFAREQGWTQEQAQKYLDNTQKLASGLKTRLTTDYDNQVKQWETETWAEKDLGGVNRPTTETNIKRAMDRFAPTTSPEGTAFREFVASTGVGNHATFVRIFNAIGKAMAEDKPLNILAGGGAPGAKKSNEEVFYPDLVKP